MHSVFPIGQLKVLLAQNFWTLSETSWGNRCLRLNWSDQEIITTRKEKLQHWRSNSRGGCFHLSMIVTMWVFLTNIQFLMKHSTDFIKTFRKFIVGHPSSFWNQPNYDCYNQFKLEYKSGSNSAQFTNSELKFDVIAESKSQHTL